MTERLQKCHRDFEKDNYALAAFLLLLSGTNRRFRESSHVLHGEMSTLIVIEFL